MAKKQTFIKPIGKMNLDLGSSPGEHSWVIKNMLLSAGGYEMMPEFDIDASPAFSSGQTPCGAHLFRGGVAERSYLALASSIFEYDNASTFTDVSGASYSNNTNGVTFASYGEFCFASNGVDPIQHILVPASTGGSTNFANMDYTDGGAQIAPKYIWSHKNHLIAANATMLANFNQLGTHTTGTGAAFTNQPANDGVQVLSLVDSANTRARSVTIYGTRNGQGDTVTFDVISLNATNSTTPVASAYTDWSIILAMKIDAVADQTIRLRETSGAATIQDITAGNTSAGVSAVSPALPAANQLVTIVADGSTTRQIGLSAYDWTGGVVYDSQALSGATAVQSNRRLLNVLEVFTGNLEATRTVTVTTFEFAYTSNHPYTVWISATDVPESFGSPLITPTFVGVELMPIYDGTGAITGGIDGGDSFFVFKEGSIHRIDGPPFVQTVISYSIGMPARCTPYRQGQFIYFWATSGLHRINVLDNSITNLFSGRALRAVTDWGNANFGFLMGAFPALGSLTPTFETANLACTENTVNISGDSRYGYVLMSFTNASMGTGMLLYQSEEDCFVIPGTTTASGLTAFGLVLWEVPSGSSNAPFPMSAIRTLSDNGADNRVGLFKLATVWSRTFDSVPYVVLPFDMFTGRDSVGRIVRVRPILSDGRGDETADPEWVGGSKVRVLSTAGYGKSWEVAKESMSTSTSADGWFNIDGCPFAKGHSIAFYLRARERTAINLTAVEVELEIQAGRSA